jgi:hypothetical protein
VRKPDHLHAAPTELGVWLQRRVAGLAALALGGLTFLIVAISQDPIFSAPDPRISIPGFTATLIAALFSWGRREKAHAYWLAGLGLAGAALVLGWFMMLAIVIGATAVLIAILHVVM